MSKNEFCHLHLHTEYSLLDGSGKIKEIIKAAKEMGMKSVAITDHGVMYGLVDFYKAAKDVGIKPILGCEIYVVAKSMYIKQADRENSNHHLVLLVKNEKGYENLMKIASKASIDGFYYKPRVDHEYLKNHSEGLIALSACLAGEVQSYELNGNYEKAKETAIFYSKIFNGDFYLELQNHGMKEQHKTNELNIKISEETGIPLVATNDVHYITKEDSKAHDVLMCIQTGKTLDDPHRRRYPSDQFYLKSPEEMWDMFSYVPEALENTIKIADSCNFDYKFHESKLPKYPLKEGQNPYTYLKDLCYSGLIERYDEFSDLQNKELDYSKINELKDKNEKVKMYVDRLEYELGIIKQMGYVDYFLIVWDFIHFAYQNKIPTGPGRGSAAGSIVAYTLGITKIDPIKYNLIFERFLNPERVSMPDIDSDFCYERRQEVIDYVVRKYGKDNVSQIITFGTMAARQCIRDVGRAMDYSYAEVDKVAKMIPTKVGTTIQSAFTLNPEFKNAYDTDERVKELIDVSLRLEGLPRHSSTHAAGVVIASNPLVSYVPLQKNEDMIVTQFGMTTLEELGLLKMDFLGLRTLTVMNDAVRMIKENRDRNIVLDKIDFDDQNVFKMIGEGKTVGVFQLESSGMTSFMKELKPDSIEDIIAGISLYRPGPMAEIPKYIEGKQNPSKVTYTTPELEPILKVTYGCLVYQEQVMQAVRDLAGYSMGRSDMVRRAMSKKKHKVMEEERKNFINGIVDEDGTVNVPGCIRNGISEEAANKIFDSMMDFASYAFNKSHAAAYAVVGYETAYLMRYYPVEMLAAMLNSVITKSDKVSHYIREASKFNIRVIPPNINEGKAKFTVKDDDIKFGLAAIKNVGSNVIDSIVETREKKGEFTSLQDFVSKIDLSCVNKRAVECLIKAGAFDTFDVYRSKLLAVYEKLMDNTSNERKKNIDGQISLFATSELKKTQIKYPDIKEFTKKNLLSMEKEMTGLYITGHPLDDYKKSLSVQVSTQIADIFAKSENNTDNDMPNDDIDIFKNDEVFMDGDRVIVGGILSSVNQKVTRNNTIMAFLRLEDLSGNIEVIVFARTYERVKKLCIADSLVVIKGRLSIKEDEETRVICESIEPLEKIDNAKVYIRADNKGAAKKINAMLKHIVNDSVRGENAVFIFAAKERQKFRVSHDKWVSLDTDIVKIFENKFGKENVKVVD
ncbi:DNA polymerase III subunit alpha [Clostridium sp. BJN0001]|uniref:DNA polymerase III subunit alpha n=1 Tax=Clostridium sp. BJN0001 TaxID=2930219 RepID=UPI001FCF9F91|nr:DNA polymerase III subunit alpha [Clostridium sp. BJN0001]